MRRRSFIQTGIAGLAMVPVSGLTQVGNAQTDNRELVVHSVHEALVHATPLQIYSGLQSLPVDDPLLIQIAGEEPTIEIWNDWNDQDLHQVFGAFIVSTPDSPIGAYRIFDTPEIAHGVHQPMVEEIEDGYLDIGGVRASRLNAGGVGFGSMRLWNVVVAGIGEDNPQVEQVMLGLVKHLGRAIGVQI